MIRISGLVCGIVLSLACEGWTAISRLPADRVDREILDWTQASQQTSSSGQEQKPPPPQNDVAEVKAETWLNTLRVSVRSDRGRILDLKVNNFQVVDSGVLQQRPVPHFSLTEEPLTLVLAVDNSGTMRLQADKVNAALQTLKGLMSKTLDKDQVFPLYFDSRLKSDTLDKSSDGKAEQSAQAKRQFNCDDSESASEKSDEKNFITEESEFQDFIDEFDPHDQTKLYDAVYYAAYHTVAYGTPFAAKGADGQPECRPRRKSVLLITDGEESGSESALDKILQYAQKKDVAVYSLGLPDGDSPYRGKGEKNLETLARVTGGAALILDPEDDVKKVAEKTRQIYEEMRKQYLLGYYPQNADKTYRKADGTYHKVQVTAGYGLRIRVKEGYYAPKD